MTSAWRASKRAQRHRRPVMAVVDTTKFVIGLVFFAAAAAMFLRARGTRGFGQARQAAAMFLLAGIVLVGIGMGTIRL